MKTSKTLKETDRFVDLARRIVAVPKKEIDRRIAEERQAKEKASKTEARKSRS